MSIPAHVAPKSETDIQRDILRYLATIGVVAWRNNSGSPIRGGFGRRRKMALTGIPDILGIMNGGRFLAIEVKRIGQKPSPEQEKFIEDANLMGALAFVACSVEDVMSRVWPRIEIVRKAK